MGRLVAFVPEAKKKYDAYKSKMSICWINSAFMCFERANLLYTADATSVFKTAKINKKLY